MRQVSGHPLQFGVFQPGFDNRRTLAGRVDFAEEYVKPQSITILGEAAIA